MIFASAAGLPAVVEYTQNMDLQEETGLLLLGSIIVSIHKLLQHPHNQVGAMLCTAIPQWYLTVASASGICQWYLPVVSANGICHCHLPVASASGICQW